jgi:catechol 2,3-dioxygenase-like lactoylglutathione lyase family enzyme
MGLISIHPKLPMRNIATTIGYYVKELGFELDSEWEEYLILSKDEIELHFFSFKELNPLENYGQVYIRVNGIDNFYKELLEKKVKIHPNGNLELKPWGQKEFALLDPDNNLLTFGEEVF